MSRQLPDRPNLDHLRKQAKELLDDLRTRNPDAQLADALHAVSREYGFASWPKLKAHVESFEATPSPFVGRWVANVARSKRNPANLFQRATIEFSVDGNTVVITHGFVEESGKRTHGAQTLVADGVERKLDPSSEYSVVARWKGRGVLETTALNAGESAGFGRYEVSADSSTLTITGPDQELVLERAK